jgi:hypothetical protein
VLSRLLIGALSTFLLIWAVLWWSQGREGVFVTTKDDLADERDRTRELGETASLLARYGFSVFAGSIGLLLGCIAVLGPGRTDWAVRGIGTMVALALAATATGACMWAWRHAFRAERLPVQERPGYVDTAVSEGPSEALAGLFWGLLPRRFALLLGGLGFAALAVLLVYAAAMPLLGEGSVEPADASRAFASAADMFELAAILLFVALLLIGIVAGLVTGEVDMSGACLALLGLYAVMLGIGYLLGLLDSQLDAAEKVLGSLGA